MEIEDLEAIAAEAVTQFRLESLPLYLVPQEVEQLTEWRAGSRRLDTPDSSPWLAHIRDTTAAGTAWSRIRILDYPLTEYSEFELHGYQANVAAGEHIFVADRRWSSDLAGLRQDFWLFDDIAILMTYDQDGRFLRPERADDAAPYLAAQAQAARHALPLARYLAGYEPHLIEA